MADPYFIYGTAWKTSATKTLVKLAIEKGFRAIDTANQPKHYTEDLVGEALAELRHEGYIQREDLFLQTKFTPVSGQDARIPYDPDTSIKTQVLTSFQSSLTHLQTDYLDAYLLHGPYGHLGLTEDDWSVWETLEQIHLSGKAKKIGVSNFNTQQLAELTQHANIKPMILQNRCFARTGWDKEVREFCHSHAILYEGFSLLTANPAVMDSHSVMDLAKKYDKTPAQIIFRFAMHIGITPLTGTSNPKHMQEDLAVNDFELLADEIALLENLR